MPGSDKLNLPADRRYNAEHVWAMPDEDGFLAGISDYAQDQLNEVMFVDLPEAGRRFGAGEVFGGVESVKSVNDLHMPLSGTVLAVNPALSERPELVNAAPYTDGWMLRFKPDDPADYAALLSAGEYAKLL